MESQMKSKSATLDIMKLRLSVQDCGYWLTWAKSRRAPMRDKSEGTYTE